MVTGGDTGYLFVKRMLDIVLGVFFCLLTIPLMVVIVVAIRADSRGRAIFRQERIGMGGEPFLVYKFRTMTVDSPTFGMKPRSFDDERLTRVGRFLRRSSLDELPQLFNVLLGQMSLVGPRPEQPFLVERYADWQRERLSVRPGMTGWWQVNGRKQPMHDFVEEDLFYVRNRSLRLDLRILGRTVGAVLRGEGAR